ncbi:MAG: hypothetical protein JNM56_25260 [Planctomycetia bacterium]|nr:hypothetical protein [Planctomycetia bacterium]
MTTPHRLRFSTLTLVWLLTTTFAHADGGTLQLSEQQGPYRIAVFTSPQPLRAGWIDLSVLVQDARTGDPLQDVNVRLVLTGPDGVERTLTASRAAATNQLFQAVRYELPLSGTWQVRVLLNGSRGPAEATFTMAAAAALPRWTELSFWIALPLIVVVLFVLHQWVLRAGQTVRRSST